MSEETEETTDGATATATCAMCGHTDHVGATCAADGCECE